MRTVADLAFLTVLPGLPLTLAVSAYRYVERAYRHPERWEDR